MAPARTRSCFALGSCYSFLCGVPQHRLTLYVGWSVGFLTEYAPGPTVKVSDRDCCCVGHTFLAAEGGAYTTKIGMCSVTAGFEPAIPLPYKYLIVWEAQDQDTIFPRSIHKA